MTGVLPWVLDSPEFRYCKEYFNLGLMMDMGAGKVRINGKFVQFIDIKEAYEMPQAEL